MKYLLFFLLCSLHPKVKGASVEDYPPVYESYSLEAQGKYAEAIEKMTLVYAKKKEDYFTNYRLGWLFSLQKKYKNSTEHYLKAADSNPKSLEPWLALSLLFLNLGDWEKAMNYSQEVIKRNKDNYFGHLRFIQAAIGAKNCPKALEKILDIVKVYPTDVIFLEQKAYCYESLGKIDEAKKEVVELKLLSPQNIYANTFMKKNK